MTAPSWVDDLRAAVRDASRRGSIEVIRGTRPSLLAGDAVHAATSVLLAALIVSAAVLRSELARGQFDLIALLLRTASLAFVVRAVIALVRFTLRLAHDARAEACALAFSPDGLYVRTTRAEHWATREEVLGFTAAEDRTARTLVQSLRPLFVVLTPAQAPRFWRLPPYFAIDADVLRARLERWRGDVHRAQPRPADDIAAEERYRRIASGRAGTGEVAVPEGKGYRRRAPYGLLLALVFVGDALIAAGPLRTRLVPAALLAALLGALALPLWFSWVHARRKVRLGIALALTPRALLVRGRHGVLEVGFDELTDVTVSHKRSWSPYVGGYVVRVLSLMVRDGSHISMDEAFLGVPVEVVAKLIAANREAPAGEIQS